MSKEVTTLIRHGTWELVPPPFDCKPVGCKWVYRVKRKSDGSIALFKARLVVKGYDQRSRLDYSETFNLVVKHVTIRTVLTMTVMKGWSLRQLDVNNAFLHEKLHETVYMTQPPGFQDATNPHHVYRLNKAIYRFKQTPRAWYSALLLAIMNLGFQKSKVDPLLFIYHNETVLCYLLVYVDDLVITGSNSSFLTHVIHNLGIQFSLKNIGTLHYFLGLDVILTTTGLFPSQHKYIRDLLSKTNM